MSRKRSKGKKQHAKKRDAVPDEVLAEGSGPVAGETDVSVLAEAAAAALADAPDAAASTDDAEVTAEPGDEGGQAEASGEEAAAEASGEEAAAEASGEEAAADASGEGAAVEASGEETAAEASGEEAAADASGDDAVVEASGEEAAAVEASGEDASASMDAAATDGAGDVEGEGEAAPMPTSAANMDAAGLKHLIEALIFASDKPLTIVRLRQLTRVSDLKRIEAALAQIAEDYKERGVMLQSVSGGYQFRTHSRFSTWVQQLIAGKPVRLSRAQLETLAIIAYRQPITRPEIDEIRGVDSSGTLRVLMDRSLIRILGKREEVGRPMLYGTTKEFLDFFSLSDLRELPTLREYSELTAESRKVMSDRLGIDPDADLVIEDDPADAPVTGDAPVAEAVAEETIAADLLAEQPLAEETLAEEALAEEALAEEALAEEALAEEALAAAEETSTEFDAPANAVADPGPDPDAEHVLSDEAADKEGLVDADDPDAMSAELLASDEPTVASDDPASDPESTPSSGE